ncbi:hypothetical protein DFH09DRAFT_1085637 [Mycena vulgaris]|nr:hypothetical protein DFH09DRAFT_1085637 [Mycena vulgaris]
MHILSENDRAHPRERVQRCKRGPRGREQEMGPAQGALQIRAALQEGNSNKALRREKVGKKLVLSNRTRRPTGRHESTSKGNGTSATRTTLNTPSPSNPTQGWRTIRAGALPALAPLARRRHALSFQKGALKCKCTRVRSTVILPVPRGLIRVPQDGSREIHARQSLSQAVTDSRLTKARRDSGSGRPVFTCRERRGRWKPAMNRGSGRMNEGGKQMNW